MTSNFKAGDIVVCVSGCYGLTLGKEYIIVKMVAESKEECIYVINDQGEGEWFIYTRFLQTNFKWGDRVVCINLEVIEQWHLKKNIIYTIDDVKIRDRQQIIHINVDPNESVEVGVWFKAEHFKKIPERHSLIYKQFEEFAK